LISKNNKLRSGGQAKLVKFQQEKPTPISFCGYSFSWQVFRNFCYETLWCHRAACVFTLCTCIQDRHKREN